MSLYTGIINGQIGHLTRLQREASELSDELEHDDRYAADCFSRAKSRMQDAQREIENARERLEEMAARQNGQKEKGDSAAPEPPRRAA